MNIHQLRCAVTVARLGSQTRAAEELYMSQPNLSKALKDLEQTCGFRIFTRTGTGMAPTRRGEEFLEHARAVLEKLDLMDAIYQGQDRRSANLSVAVCGAGYLTRALCAFLDETNPAEGLEINMREGRVEEVVRAVLDREAEIGVIRYVWTGRTGCWPLWGSRGCTICCTGPSGMWPWCPAAIRWRGKNGWKKHGWRPMRRSRSHRNCRPCSRRCK